MFKVNNKDCITSDGLNGVYNAKNNLTILVQKNNTIVCTLRIVRLMLACKVACKHFSKLFFCFPKQQIL